MIVGHLEINRVSHTLPDGRQLLAEVSFRVGEGVTAALIGPNGVGKTTLLRMLTGELIPQSGAVIHTGGMAFMPQFIGGIRDESTVHDLLVRCSPHQLRSAALELVAAELLIMDDDTERSQLRYAQAIIDYGDAGGYEAETLWDVVTMAAFNVAFERARWRPVNTSHNVSAS